MTNITRLYRRLQKLSIPGVVAIQNDKLNSVYILYSRNILDAIIRTIKDRNYRNFSIILLDTYSDVTDLKLEASWWMLDYINRGYTILNKQIPVRYKIRISINEDYKVDVLLVPTRAKPTLLGTFNTMQEAKAYAEVQEKKYKLCKTVI